MYTSPIPPTARDTLLKNMHSYTCTYSQCVYRGYNFTSRITCAMPSNRLIQHCMRVCECVEETNPCRFILSQGLYGTYIVVNMFLHIRRGTKPTTCTLHHQPALKKDFFFSEFYIPRYIIHTCAFK